MLATAATLESASTIARIGLAFRLRRRAVGLTRRDLSRRAGIAINTLAALETDATSTSLNTLARVDLALSGLERAQPGLAGLCFLEAGLRHIESGLPEPRRRGALRSPTRTDAGDGPVAW